MDLEKMTLIELKALYFDTLRTREIAQRNLEAINNEINKKEQQPKPQEDRINEAYEDRFD